MARFLLIIGIILIVLWGFGFIAFRSFYLSTPLVHVLIVIGVILIILEVFRSRRNWW
jgi:hypothetical protein